MMYRPFRNRRRSYSNQYPRLSTRLHISPPPPPPKRDLRERLRSMPHTTRFVMCSIVLIILLLVIGIVYNSAISYQQRDAAFLARTKGSHFTQDRHSQVSETRHVSSTPTSASLLASSLTPTATRLPVLPTPTHKPSQLFVTFTSMLAVNHLSGVISVHSLPNALLTLTVTYCSGSTARNRTLLGVSHADSSGNHTWRWRPDSECQGIATATVTAALNNQWMRASHNFIVR